MLSVGEPIHFSYLLNDDLPSLSPMHRQSLYLLFPPACPMGISISLHPRWNWSSSSLSVPPSMFSMNITYTKHLRMAWIPPSSSLAIETTNQNWMELVTPGYCFILHLPFFPHSISFSGLWLFPSVFFVPVSQLLSRSSLAPLCITAGITLLKRKSNQI